MKRSGFLKRGKPLRRKGKTQYARRPRDIDYMLTVKKLGCVMGRLREKIIGHGGDADVITPCYGRVEADHAGTRGVGQKAADDTVIPMCQGHHRERTDYRGSFKNYVKETMRDFCDWAIEHTRKQVAEVRRISIAMGGEPR